MCLEPTRSVDRSRQARGRWGEQRAADEYRRQGYTVLARNWRCSLGEIDLILRRGDVLVICEVKARRTGNFGTAATAVDWRKQRRLRRLAARWLAETRPGPMRVRFDVAAIDGVRLEIIEAAF